MRLSELSETTGVSIASIKFYRRRGLVPPPDRLHPTLGEYGTAHVERLGLIRTLRGVLDLPLERIETLCRAIDDPGVSLLHLMGLAQSLALSDVGSETAENPVVTRWCDRSASTPPNLAARRLVSEQVNAMVARGLPVSDELLDTYGEAALLVARHDVSFVHSRSTRDGAVLQVAVGTQAYTELVRRMVALAQASLSIQGASPTERESTG